MVIRLRDIQCYAYHGVLEEEKQKGKGGLRKGKERGSRETGWRETGWREKICSNFPFKRRKSQRQSKLMH